MWTTSKEERAFEDTLTNWANDTLSSKVHYPKDIIDKRTQTLIMAKRFLSSMEEFTSLLEKPDQEFWNLFLDAATQALKVPSEKNYLNLYRYMSMFKASHKEEWSYTTNGMNIFTNSMTFTIATGGVVASSVYLLNISLAVAALAMGPWGAAALCAAVLVASLVVAIIYGIKLHKNIRAYNDKQLNEINDFVEFLNPNPGVLISNNYQRATPNSNSGNPNFFNTAGVKKNPLASENLMNQEATGPGF
ncbi:MAG: hypothetical protein H0U73_06670 [Tatlockia sp.]|nr:hypothetical protein [Tatlockia sp.]